jgi:hypothetical protein
MIKFALQCDRGHGFESWFPSGASYDQQVKRGLVGCPDCGSVKIEKQIMAPSVRLREGGQGLEPQDVPPPAAPPPDQSMALMSEQALKMRAMIRDLHAHVTANTEDVGAAFVDEARAIHAGDKPERAIRGKASLDDAKALHDEGIGVLPLPPLPDERN